MDMVRTNNQENRILILADFSEGSWTAIRFAMEYLYEEDSKIYILQTWQKPSYGSSMVRDLAPILQNIARNELQALRKRMVDHYSFSKKDIRLLDYEGGISDFFVSEEYTTHDWQVVLATKNQITNLNENPRFTEIIDLAKQPLYMLHEVEYVKSIENIFVMADSEQVSEQLLLSLEAICHDQKCKVQICLDTDMISVGEKERQIKRFSAACDSSILKFTKICSKNGALELKEYENKKSKRLMIFNKSRDRKVESKFKSYVDKWFVRSKGINIGNY